MTDLAAAIRVRLDSTHVDASAAVVAVLAKCEAITGNPQRFTASERSIADEVVQVIARALGIHND